MAQSPKNKASGGDRVISKNRRAFFDFEVGDRYEAGLVLMGSEARALRENPADLTDAWVDIDSRGEAWVRGLRIPRLRHAAFGHEERRARKLLLNRSEIDKLKGAIEKDGMTIVVTDCHFKNNHAKLEIAIARGKKRHDKRQALRERDASKEARQAMQKGKWR